MASGAYAQIFSRKTRTFNWLRRERIRRQLHVRVAVRKLLLATMSRTSDLSSLAQARVRFCASGLQLESSLTRQHGRCLNSGRAHFVVRRVGLARMAFRQYARLGKLPQIVRRTW